MSNVGGYIIASVNSRIYHLPAEKERDRIVDRVEFSGQLFMSNANGRDGFFRSRSDFISRIYNMRVSTRSLILPTASPVTHNLQSRAKLMACVRSFLIYNVLRYHYILRIYFS